MIVRIPRSFRLGKRTLIVVAALALFGLILAERDRSGDRPAAAASDDVAFAAYRQTRAAQAEVGRLTARVDALELRISVLEATSGYTTANGTHLPAVPDPLAPATNVSAP